VAQGLAFLFGATPTFGVPVCLRTRLRGVSTYFSDGIMLVSRRPTETNLVVIVRTRFTGVTLRGDGFSTW
jgi:hypothetical protein